MSADASPPPLLCVSTGQSSAPRVSVLPRPRRRCSDLEVRLSVRRECESWLKSEKWGRRGLLPHGLLCETSWNRSHLIGPQCFGFLWISVLLPDSENRPLCFVYRPEPEMSPRQRSTLRLWWCRTSNRPASNDKMASVLARLKQSYLNVYLSVF